VKLQPIFPYVASLRYLTIGANMLKAAGYDNPVHLMQLAYDVEYRIASFDNSEDSQTCATPTPLPFPFASGTQNPFLSLLPVKQSNLLSRPLLCPAAPPAVDARVRYTGYDGSADPSDTEDGFVCEEKHAKLNDLPDTISKDIDWRAYVEVRKNMNNTLHAQC